MIEDRAAIARRLQWREHEHGAETLPSPRSGSPAKIIIPGGGALPCRVCNESEGGAKLRVGWKEWLPKSFDLQDAFSGARRAVQIVWRHFSTMGVGFRELKRGSAGRSEFGRRRFRRVAAAEALAAPSAAGSPPRHQRVCSNSIVDPIPVWHCRYFDRARWWSIELAISGRDGDGQPIGGNAVNLFSIQIIVEQPSRCEVCAQNEPIFAPVSQAVRLLLGHTKIESTAGRFRPRNVFA